MSTVNPFVLASIVGVAVALAALIAACVVRNSAIRAALFVMALIFLLPAGFVVPAAFPRFFDSRFGAYWQFYQDIETGMTREQVMTALDNHYPEHGPRKRPKTMEDTPQRLGFFMNPEGSSEPNCEGIFLALESDRVTSKIYSAD